MAIQKCIKSDAYNENKWKEFKKQVMKKMI